MDPQNNFKDPFHLEKMPTENPEQKEEILQNQFKNPMTGEIKTGGEFPKNSQYTPTENPAPQKTTFSSILEHTNIDPNNAPIRTYKNDVAEAIRAKESSIVSIQMAEKKRQERERGDESEPILNLQTILIVLGIILLLAGGVAIGGLYFYAGYNKNKTPQIVLPKSIIIFDKEKEINTNGWNREKVTQIINGLKTEFLDPNTVENLSLVTSVGTTNSKTNIRDIFSNLNTQTDPALLRSFDKDYMLGFSAGTPNKPFLIIQTSLYENAFAGMLAWEKTMVKDLSPIFGETKTTPVAPAVTFDNLTATTSSSTKKTTSSSASQTAILSPVSQSVIFTDLVVSNKDTRVAKDQNGQTILLYSFLDQNTLVITPDENTFKQILDKFIASKLVK